MNSSYGNEAVDGGGGSGDKGIKLNNQIKSVSLMMKVDIKVTVLWDCCECDQDGWDHDGVGRATTDGTDFYCEAVNDIGE